jgi:hypothetical protein
MKKQITLPLCLRAFVAIFFMLLFSQLVTAQSTGMEKQLEKLTQQLNLSEEQTTKVREFLQEVQLQKETDRQTYKTDALALIQAAWTRRNHVDNKIEPILDSQQLEEPSKNFLPTNKKNCTNKLEKIDAKK